MGYEAKQRMRYPLLAWFHVSQMRDMGGWRVRRDATGTGACALVLGPQPRLSTYNRNGENIRVDVAVQRKRQKRGDLAIWGIGNLPPCRCGAKPASNRAQQPAVAR